MGKCLREDQRGNRWTQGGEGGKEGGRRDQRETAGRREEKGKEGGPAGNRWTQGEEGEGGRTSGETAGRREEKEKEEGPAGKPLDAGRGKGRREEGGELTLTNTIIKKNVEIMTDKEKLTALMEKFSGGSQQVFAQLIGVPRSNIATWMHRNSITANGREAILDTFPQVSREWLMGNSVRYSVAPASKRADMLTDDANVIRFSREDLVPLYDECRASCGVVEQFEHPEYATEFIHVPGSDAIAALTAEGISMEPSIHSGDYCLIGSSIDLQDADDKHIYLIVTKDGQCMFKRIFNEGRRAENILVLSENPDYSPHAQAVAKADILHVYPLRYVVHRMW
ncbi:MAG: S24 family peptidase [Bacteroidaceae bacterium]|nr:S24 family peptidase [Bacteroidaceae bacterium]